MVVQVISLDPSNTAVNCDCNVLQHPQSYYCDSDFVAVLNIKKASEVIVAKAAVFQVGVEQIFKATQEARIALEGESVWVRGSATKCNLNRLLRLTPGTTWLVSGKMVAHQLYSSFCGYTEQWSSLPRPVQNSFQHFYQRGCACSIWQSGVHLADKTGCLLNVKNLSNVKNLHSHVCQVHFGICVPSSAGCSWMSANSTSDGYNKCMSNVNSSR